MYWESYDNTPADQFNPGIPFNQPPQYPQANQFISNNFSQMPAIQDQEMPLQDSLQDASIFQMPTPNQIPFQDQIHPVPMEESVPQTPLPQSVVNEQVTQERPETPGSNVRITRSRLRGKCVKFVIKVAICFVFLILYFYIRSSARSCWNHYNVYVEKATS